MIFISFPALCANMPPEKLLPFSAQVVSYLSNVLVGKSAK